jgi:hypothetical protein
MGLQIEVNTMFRLGQDDPKPETLTVGMVFKASKPNLRLYPVGLPIILLSEDWQAQGYCVVKRAEMNPEGMNLEIEVTTRFSETDSKIHTERVIEALTKTGYLPRK